LHHTRKPLAASENPSKKSKNASYKPTKQKLDNAERKKSQDRLGSRNASRERPPPAVDGAEEEIQEQPE